jgi:hypothetical protein
MYQNENNNTTGISYMVSALSTICEGKQRNQSIYLKNMAEKKKKTYI